MRSKLLPFFLLLLTGCSSQIASRNMASNQNLEEVKIALMDVRRAYSAQQMDIQLLEEKLAKLVPTKAPQGSTNIESRLQKLEQMQEGLVADLKQLSLHANQTTDSLVYYKNQIQALDTMLKKQSDRLNEVVKLRGTLDSISKAIESQSYNGKSYTVRSGDSLEKIARRFHTDVKTLKQLNSLSSNTIIIGQELKIPN